MWEVWHKYAKRIRIELYKMPPSEYSVSRWLHTVSDGEKIVTYPHKPINSYDSHGAGTFQKVVWLRLKNERRGVRIEASKAPRAPAFSNYFKH